VSAHDGIVVDLGVKTGTEETTMQLNGKAAE
jgi:hypothetical protein